MAKSRITPIRTPSEAELEAEAQLWRKWHGERDRTAREQLITMHHEFARMMAAKLYANRYSDEFEFGDFMQFATLGLIESVDRYNPAYQNSFRTFSTQRIRGAILDGLASMSEFQQQIHSRQRVLAERIESFSPEQPGERSPSHVFEQLASVAIGLALGYMLENTAMYQPEEPAVPDNTYVRLELRQLQEQLRHSLSRLPHREQCVITHHYMHFLPFDAIADMLGLSKGRVSQLHRNALLQLRQELSRSGQLDAVC